jgi:peptidyl-prolyl cis-trans isomerase SurA
MSAGFLALAVVLGATPAGTPRLAAQQGELVDRIVAVVGDSVITLTQLQERLFQMRAQGVEIPTEASALAQLQRELLDQVISEQLIVQAALQDSTIVVDDAQLDEVVSQDLQQRARSYPGGQTAFQVALQDQGWTLASYREFLRGQVRQQQLYQQYMAKRSRELATIVVEEAEVEAFFQEQRERLGERPPTVAFTQIIVLSTASDSSKEAARTEAERIRQMALAGEDFEELARRFSQEPGAQESGGDLGWFRRGDMVDAFEDAAFNLAVDEISETVETPFGFHVIKVERRRSGEVRARHILMQAEVSEEDQTRARQTAESVRARLEVGEDFVSLREEFGDPQSPDSLEIPFDQLRDLPPGFAEPLIQGEAGQVLGPLEFEAQGVTRYAVLHVEEVRDGGEFSLDELRGQIRERLQQDKLVSNILEELRSRTYIQIRI